jgi:hypothetical protein
MEKLSIDFHGYITVDKNDIVLTVIDNKTGKMLPVDAKDLTPKEICDGVSNGTYYVSFEKTNKNTLDGEMKMTVEIENE